MPLPSSIVGASTAPLEHQVDARWLMAYAAALGDFNPRFMDTAGHNIVAHPVFPVCPEWPVILSVRNVPGMAAMRPEESARGVHAAHDLHLYRPIVAGDRLVTQGTLIGVRAIRPGAAYIMRLDTTCADTSELVARTYQTGIYRNVEVDGGDAMSEDPPLPPRLSRLSPGAADTRSAEIPIMAGAAHTYTECARIWNPIHTDRAVALAAGLPDIILHGTATLALAVSQVVNQYCNADPSHLRRLGGRFAAMVRMPSTITVDSRQKGNLVTYQVRTDDGDLAIRDGFCELEHPHT